MFSNDLHKYLVVLLYLVPIVVWLKQLILNCLLLNFFPHTDIMRPADSGYPVISCDGMINTSVMPTTGCYLFICSSKIITTSLIYKKEHKSQSSLKAGPKYLDIFEKKCPNMSLALCCMYLDLFVNWIDILQFLLKSSWRSRRILAYWGRSSKDANECYGSFHRLNGILMLIKLELMLLQIFSLLSKASNGNGNRSIDQ